MAPLPQKLVIFWKMDRKFRRTGEWLDFGTTGAYSQAWWGAIEIGLDIALSVHCLWFTWTCHQYGWTLMSIYENLPFRSISAAISRLVQLLCSSGMSCDRLASSCVKSSMLLASLLAHLASGLGLYFGSKADRKQSWKPRFWLWILTEPISEYPNMAPNEVSPLFWRSTVYIIRSHLDVSWQLSTFTGVQPWPGFITALSIFVRLTNWISNLNSSDT